MATLEEQVKKAAKMKAAKGAGNKTLDGQGRRGQTQRMHPRMDASAKGRGKGGKEPC